MEKIELPGITDNIYTEKSQSGNEIVTTFFTEVDGETKKLSATYTTAVESDLRNISIDVEKELMSVLAAEIQAELNIIKENN